jgi:hypothetical protein
MMGVRIPPRVLLFLETIMFRLEITGFDTATQLRQYIEALGFPKGTAITFNGYVATVTLTDLMKKTNATN